MSGYFPVFVGEARPKKGCSKLLGQRYLKSGTRIITKLRCFMQTPYQQPIGVFQTKKQGQNPKERRCD